jgi:hypothetical protein
MTTRPLRSAALALTLLGGHVTHAEVANLFPNAGFDEFHGDGRLLQLLRIGSQIALPPAAVGTLCRCAPATR